MKIRRTKWIAIGLIFGTSFNAKSQVIVEEYASEVQKAKAFIDSIKNAQNIPSVSIAVGFNRKILWQEAWGYSNVENNEEATINTKYRVGSISKPMTAFGLATLFETGEIDFNDPVGEYVESFKDKAYASTIKQVAGHQGGIRHYKGFEFLSNKQYNSVEESMTIFEEDDLLFEPGTKYQYSTYGYVLLSRVIEKASGQEYLDFMQTKIFEPLGMDNTVAENSGSDESQKATFYRKNGKREAGEVNLSSKWAGGGFLSTPGDLVSMVNNATKVISPQTLMTMIMPQTLAKGEPTEYGIGWRNTVVKSNGRMIVHHGGTSAGARSFLLLLPNEQIVVAICTNSDADFGLQEVYDISKFFIK